ncbi:MAG: dihydroorotase [Gammaproteobacteria bacterium]|jgi:dihydroorotase
MKILIKHGKVIDPSQKRNGVADILIENKQIISIERNIKTKADKIIDAHGKIVAPGFIDMHTHLREPGEENKETIASGARAALYGGFTTICAMPNTIPACDNAAQIQFILDKGKQAGFANVLPIGAITKDRAGKEMTEMAEMQQVGCIAVSDDGGSVDDTKLLRRAMEYAAMFKLPVICHCEDKNLFGKGVIHEGYWSTVLGLRGIPSEAESIIVGRDIQLAALTGVHLHIAHVSTAQSVDLIRQAKKRGVKVTAEATPHHFTLTDAALQNYDTNCKVNPPLRSKDDVKAICKGLKDGTIDAIATDHAPHLQVDKEKEFDYAPFGLIGLETALSLAIMQLIDKKILTWPELINKLSCNPNKILRLNKGTLKPGAIADIVIIDPKKTWRYTKDQIKSKSHNSPFIDWEMKGKVETVVLAGKIWEL